MSYIVSIDFRIFYALQVFCKDKTQLETWISQNGFSIENCAVGDESVISQLLSKYKALLTRNADMVKLREGMYKQLDDMSIHEMCSKKASNDVRTQLNQLNTKQVCIPCILKMFFFSSAKARAFLLILKSNQIFFANMTTGCMGQPTKGDLLSCYHL